MSGFCFESQIRHWQDLKCYCNDLLRSAKSTLKLSGLRSSKVRKPGVARVLSAKATKTFLIAQLPQPKKGLIFVRDRISLLSLRSTDWLVSGLVWWSSVCEWFLGRFRMQKASSGYIFVQMGVQQTLAAFAKLTHVRLLCVSTQRADNILPL